MQVEKGPVESNEVEELSVSFHSRDRRPDMENRIKDFMSRIGLDFVERVYKPSMPKDRVFPNKVTVMSFRLALSEKITKGIK